MIVPGLVLLGPVAMTLSPHIKHKCLSALSGRCSLHLCVPDSLTTKPLHDREESIGEI
jgi:hypothetical protein